MRFYLCIFFFSLLLSLNVAAQDNEISELPRAEITARLLHLRSAPNSQSESHGGVWEGLIVTILRTEQGEAIDVMDETNDTWYLVRVDATPTTPTREGYVWAGYVQVLPPSHDANNPFASVNTQEFAPQPLGRMLERAVIHEFPYFSGGACCYAAGIVVTVLEVVIGEARMMNGAVNRTWYRVLGWADLIGQNWEGFVWSGYVEPFRGLIGDTSSESMSLDEAITATVMSETVNVRPDPSTSNAPVGTLAYGNQIEVLEEISTGQVVSGNPIWYRILFGNHEEGYVWGGVVTVQHPLGPAPCATADRASNEARPSNYWMDVMINGSQLLYEGVGIIWRLDRSWQELDEWYQPIVLVSREDKLAVWREYAIWMMARASKSPLAGATFEQFLANRVAAQQRGQQPTITVMAMDVNTGEAVEAPIALGNVSWSGRLSDGSLRLTVEGGVVFETLFGTSNTASSPMVRGLRVPLMTLAVAGYESFHGVYIDPADPCRLMAISALPARENVLQEQGSAFNRIATELVRPFYTLSLDREAAERAFSGRERASAYSSALDFRAEPLNTGHARLFYGIGDPESRGGFIVFVGNSEWRDGWIENAGYP